MQIALEQRSFCFCSKSKDVGAFFRVCVQSESLTCSLRFLSVLGVLGGVGSCLVHLLENTVSRKNNDSCFSATVNCLRSIFKA